MQPAVTRRYLLVGLEGTPAVLERLLGPLAADDTRWDARPDPERFTLREVLAHLASAEPHWVKRAERTRDEDTPFLPKVLPDENTASNTPLENLALIREHRVRYVAHLKGLDEAGWGRLAQSEFLGTVSVEQHAIFVQSHDGYHLQQIAEWVGPEK